LINGYDLGANSYVCQPIQSDQFAATVAQLSVFWLITNEQPPTTRTLAAGRQRRAQSADRRLVASSSLTRP